MRPSSFLVCGWDASGGTDFHEPLAWEQRWLRELRLRAGPVGRPAPAWRVLRSDGFRSDPSASTVVGQADGAVRYSNFFSQATYSSIKAVAKDFVIEFGPADPTQLSHPRVSDYLGPKTAVKAFEANYDTSGAEEAFWSHLEEQKKALKANENFPFFFHCTELWAWKVEIGEGTAIAGRTEE